MRRKKKTQVKSTPEIQLVIDKNLVKEYEGNFFRTYSFMDLLNLIHVRNLLRRGQELTTIPDQTILSVYDGHTIFSIFQMNAEVFEKIYQQIKTRNFEDSLDAYKRPTEDQFLRRFYKILTTPTKDQCLSDQNCQEEPLNWCQVCKGRKKDELTEEDRKQKDGSIGEC